jgi:hypothetical protein
LPYVSTTFIAPVAKIGIYRIDTNSVELPPAQDLILTRAMLRGTVLDSGNTQLAGNTIFMGSGTPGFPEVGDVRVTFRVVHYLPNVTVFGQLSGDEIIPYTMSDSAFLYRVFYGDRVQALQQLREEYRAQLWGSRIGSFFMLWCGLFLLFNPVTIFVSFFPALRKAGTIAIGLLVLPIALLLIGLTIAVSFVVHNLIVLLLIILLAMLVIVGGVGAFYLLERDDTPQ